MKKSFIFFSSIFIYLLTGCGGSSSSSPTPPAAVNPTVSTTSPKVLTFSWDDVSSDHYKLLKNPDGVSGYTQVGSDIFTTSVDETIPVHLQDWFNASYIIQSCDTSDACTDSQPISATSLMLGAIGYFKASNTDIKDWFSYAVSLAADGNTLAVGAYREASSATGINGDQSDDSALYAGAVYVFSRSGTTWTQQAYIKASNTGESDRFGWSVSLSGDGNILAVGADGEDSSATGINGDQDDNSATSSGATYVFSRNGIVWSQQAYIKASNTGASDRFGQSVSLSGDGNILAVGADGEDSSATGINGDQGNDLLTENSGAVYVFSNSDSTWTQQAYIKASNTDADDEFGDDVSLAADGNTLVAGASEEESSATGINGDQSDDSALYAGAVYVFSRSGTTWVQQAYIKASNTGTGDWFGNAVSIAADGNTLAVSAYDEDSSATGINGDQVDNLSLNSGAVYVFSRSSMVWTQQAYIKASNTDAEDQFGVAVSLAADGNTLAVGAYVEYGSATGINGDQADNLFENSGAVYVFKRIGTIWSQQAYVKASNTDSDDYFGRAVSLSADGNTLAVGAYGEDSSVTGIDGDQADNLFGDSGAVYLY